MIFGASHIRFKCHAGNHPTFKCRQNWFLLGPSYGQVMASYGKLTICIFQTGPHPPWKCPHRSRRNLPHSSVLHKLKRFTDLLYRFYRLTVKRTQSSEAIVEVLLLCLRRSISALWRPADSLAWKREMNFFPKGLPSFWSGNSRTIQITSDAHPDNVASHSQISKRFCPKSFRLEISALEDLPHKLWVFDRIKSETKSLSAVKIAN